MDARVKPDRQLRLVGTRPVRPDGVEKVTGRARFGADYTLPGALFGAVLRSPHAHARIVSIDTSRALALPGVKAAVTGADFPEIPSEEAFVGEGPVNFRDLSHNVMARGKALYDGHAVAAIAAVSQSVARQALALIDVKYEALPHVIDVREAMRDDAPLLHDDLFTAGVTPEPGKPSNIAKRVEFGHGDPEAGFEKADVIIEREYTTAPVHQGYIEPHAALANVDQDGQCQVWASSQGHFMIRAYCAKLLNIELARLKVTPAEIGGGFGGKTLVYLEPLALLLSQKSGRPVKMVMSREEVFRASGPTSGSHTVVKIGATRDGKIVAAQARIHLQAGAFPGAPVGPAAMTAFAPYDISDVKSVAFDVVVNRPKVGAYRAPGAPLSEFPVESAIDELANQLGLDPVEFRLRNAAREKTRSSYGPVFKRIGFVETLEAIKNHPHYKAPLGPDQGRGIASGFWFNIGGESTATLNISEDGGVALIIGSPDIGGSRASLAMMTAETLGIDLERVKPMIADTNAIGYTFLTGGSRVTYATGMACVQAAEAAIKEMCGRAAQLWGIDPDNVEWRDGAAYAIAGNTADLEPLTLADIAAQSAKTGGPITGHVAINAQGAGPGFGSHICDVEVDRETGRVSIVRYTAVQDAGRAIHPSYVEGQIQGGVAQGIGWALNEEYLYDQNGRLENPGFLDYRIPVCSDLPMIDTVIVEVDNPNHPFGVRGVGEVPIIPPLAAVANAIENALGKRLVDLPMSPPKVLAALDD
ncbi:MAG: xanthine dehydrogenase family protein molybdopterin-binding subunit [Burkholderiaceae bacterium]